ncbi:MAG: hypothetical protein R2864_09915 [Syntrophotaleaceae bacterium]
MIGINNRDLKSFHTDLAVTSGLLPMIPSTGWWWRKVALAAEPISAGAAEKKAVLGRLRMAKADKTDLKERKITRGGCAKVDSYFFYSIPFLHNRRIDEWAYCLDSVPKTLVRCVRKTLENGSRRCSAPWYFGSVGRMISASIFPMSLIEQEVSRERWIEIPEEVQKIYQLWRPSPLIPGRLRCGFKAPARIYYKYEGFLRPVPTSPIAPSPGLLQQDGGD